MKKNVVLYAIVLTLFLVSAATLNAIASPEDDDISQIASMLAGLAAFSFTAGAVSGVMLVSLRNCLRVK